MDDWNSVINGQDDYTNRIVSNKSEADAAANERASDPKNIDKFESLEIYNRANQGKHPK